MGRSDSVRICLLGLPKTGKTTFIAALWSFLSSGPPADAYRIAEYPDDPTYLNEIADAWARGDPMPRNSLGSEDRIEFTISRPAGAHLTLVLPDLPGETFLDAVVRPRIEETTAAAVVGVDLLLLFVNGESARTYSALGDMPTNSRDDMEVSPREFAIEELDSDTLNTELVQRMDFLLQTRTRPALAVVVAAWDAVCDTARTPRKWLTREQPMLAQLLMEYGRSSTVEVIGVSAQGANYTDDPAIVEQLADIRPWGCDAGGERTDICGPLVWFNQTGGNAVGET